MATTETARAYLSIVACLLALLGQQSNVHAQSTTRLTPADFQTRAAELISERVQITGELRGTTLHDPRGSAQVRISLDRAPATTTRWLSDNGCRTRCSGVTLTGQVVVLPSTGRPVLMVSGASRPAASAGKAANAGNTVAEATEAIPALISLVTPKSETTGVSARSNIASSELRAELSMKLTPASDEFSSGFNVNDMENWGGTWALECDRPGTPRVHVLPNGLVLEDGGVRLFSNADRSTAIHFAGPNPPPGFMIELWGDTFMATLFRDAEGYRLQIWIHAESSLANTYGGAQEIWFRACSDVGATQSQEP